MKEGLIPTRRCGKKMCDEPYTVIYIDALGEVAAIRFLSIDCCAGKPH